MRIFFAFLLMALTAFGQVKYSTMPSGKTIYDTNYVVLQNPPFLTTNDFQKNTILEIGNYISNLLGTVTNYTVATNALTTNNINVMSVGTLVLTNPLAVTQGGTGKNSFPANTLLGGNGPDIRTYKLSGNFIISGTNIDVATSITNLIVLASNVVYLETTNWFTNVVLTNIIETNTWITNLVVMSPVTNYNTNIVYVTNWTTNLVIATNYDVIASKYLVLTNPLEVAYGGTGLQNLGTNLLLAGKGTNPMTAIGLGTGLSLSGTNLTATGGSNVLLYGANNIGVSSNATATEVQYTLTEKVPAITNILLYGVTNCHITSNVVGGTVAYYISIGGVTNVAPSPPTNPPSASLTPDLVWWKFNEGAGTSVTDNSSNGTHTCTLSSAMMWTTGKSGTGIQGNGSTYSAFSAANIAFNTNKITVCFWLKDNAWQAGPELAFELGNPFYSYQAPTFYNDATLFHMNLMVVGQGYREETLPVVSTGAWHHYLIVYDESVSGGEITLYVDGALQSTTLANNTMGAASSTFSTQTVYLLSRGGTALQSDAQMDDFRIYSGDKSSIVADIYADPQ